MSGSPLRDVVVAVQLGLTEEVGQHVVHSWTVLGADGEVVAVERCCTAVVAGRREPCCASPVG